MADSKLILLFVILCSISTFVIGSACNQLESSNSCQDLISNTFILDTLFNNPIMNSNQIDDFGGLELTDTLTDSVNDMTTATGGGQSFSTIVAVFLDPIKMTLSVLSLFTPIPIIDFFNALGMPFWLNLIITGPLFVLYILGLVEFVRGGSF